MEFCEEACSQAEGRKIGNCLTEESSKVSRMRNMRKLKPGNSLMPQEEERTELPMPHSRI